MTMGSDTNKKYLSIARTEWLMSSSLFLLLLLPQRQICNSLYYEDPDSNWLRKVRNRYVHLNVNDPGLNIDRQYDKRKELGNDATKAITMVVITLLQNPGI
jgi:hypothetical protein